MAVASPPAQDSLVSQPARERVYAARRSDLQLIKTPRYPTLGPGNVKVGETPGVTLQFQDGVLRLPLEGEVTTKHGVPVGVEELHGWLARHRLFGDREEGFIVVEQVAPTVSPAEMQALMDAAMKLDADALEEIIEQERAGWARPELLVPAGESLGKVRGMVAQQEEAAKGSKAKA